MQCSADWPRINTIVIKGLQDVESVQVHAKLSGMLYTISDEQVRMVQILSEGC